MNIQAEDSGSEKRASILASLRGTDVYCGQDASIAHTHYGNQVFRSVINSNSERYQQAKRRAEKTMITIEVIEEIKKRGGRFVKADPLHGKMVTLEDSAIHDKVSHALRTNKDRKSASSRRSSSLNSLNSSGKASMNAHLHRESHSGVEEEYFASLAVAQQQIFASSSAFSTSSLVRDMQECSVIEHCSVQPVPSLKLGLHPAEDPTKSLARTNGSRMLTSDFQAPPKQPSGPLRAFAAIGSARKACRMKQGSSHSNRRVVPDFVKSIMPGSGHKARSAKVMICQQEISADSMRSLMSFSSDLSLSLRDLMQSASFGSSSRSGMDFGGASSRSLMRDWIETPPGSERSFDYSSF